MTKVLVTGGAGYIGSHVMVALGQAGYGCVCVDNYSNSSPRSVERASALVPGTIESFQADIRDTNELRRIIAATGIGAVIHMAGLKSVGESIEKPDLYYDNNVGGTRSLLEALADTPSRRLVFSSSATVYGHARTMPITEEAPTAPINPYGDNKLEIERMLEKLAAADPSWRIANLRYFNPVGGHESGTMGEHPAGIPNNLMPFVCQTAAGKRGSLSIFGNDYDTPDGTCIRDYIHVMDLAEGHVAALRALEAAKDGTVLTVNLGTGHGHSVLELVETFERVNGVKVPRQIAARRPGDSPVSYADCSKAKALLGWEARRNLEDMCRDAWRWQRQNPDGFA